MKSKTTWSFVAVVFCTFLFAKTAFCQNSSYTDVVYLKNGSIIKGVIIENTPNVEIKLKTSDGSLFVYSYKDVQKFGKEEQPEKHSAKKSISSANNSTSSSFLSKGRLFVSPNLGYAYPFDLPDGEDSYSLSLNGDVGYYLLKRFAIVTTFGINHNSTTVSSSTGTIRVPYTYYTYSSNGKTKIWHTGYRNETTTNEGSSSSSTSISYGAGVRFYPFSRLYLGANLVSYKADGQDAVSTTNFQVGYVGFITNRFAIESSVCYIMGIGDNDSYKALQGKVGVGFYF